MQLNTVVLPAPLGPISPTTLPSRTEKDTSLTAISPPKILVTLSSSSKVLSSDMRHLLRGRPLCGCPLRGGGRRLRGCFRLRRCGGFPTAQKAGQPFPHLIAARQRRQQRSEERRVGKECRSRWSP